MLAELKSENGSNMHNTTDVDTVKRAIRAIEIECYYKENVRSNECSMPKVDSVIFGISVERDERRRRITKRLRQRLDDGMVDEVRGLLSEGIPAENLIYYGLEYKYVTQYIIGEFSYEEMFRRLEIAIHQFAKRQMTWFRGMERRGFKIHWIDAGMSIDDKIALVGDIYENER
jgi:tRNA dimethylallyltransferase